MNIMAVKAYYNDKGRPVTLDISPYGYRKNNTHGFVNGHLSPSPSLRIVDEQDKGNMFHELNITKEEYFYNESRKAKTRAINDPTTKLLFVDPIYDRVHMNLVPGGSNLDKYNRMAVEACTNFQFNPDTRRLVDDFRMNHNATYKKGETSVAFHVRRGDKLISEAKLTPALTYVDKMLNITKEQHIDHCFVTSDEFAAVTEVKQALATRDVTCQFHTFTKEEETGFTGFSGRRWLSYQPEELIAELSLLVDSTYFVGTFSSNIGSFAALLRKCAHPHAPHWAHSYGVDGDKWRYQQRRRRCFYMRCFVDALHWTTNKSTHVSTHTHIKNSALL